MNPLGVALGLAYLTGGLVGQALAARRGVSPTRWWWVVVILMATTVVGARLWYVASDATYYLQNPADVWRPPIEGLSFGAGLVVGAVVSIGASRYLGLRLVPLLDVIGLSYLAGSVVAGVVWRTPVSLYAASIGWVTLLDALYVTGLYVLLWRLWTRERAFQRVGASAITTLVGDGLLRLGLGSVAWFFASDGAAGSVWLHGARVALLVLAVGVFLLRLRGARPPGGMRPFHRPISRWLGWIMVYGVLIALLVVVRA